MTDEEAKQNIEKYLNNSENITFIKDYYINDDLSIDADRVQISETEIKGRIPIRFRNTNQFVLTNNKYIDSLKGCPIQCKDFICHNNALTSLEYCPKGYKVLNMSNNNLTNLEHCPDGIEVVYVNNNKLTSLKGLPNNINNLNIVNNSELYSIDHFPQKYKRGYVYVSNTPLSYIYIEEIMDVRMEGTFSIETFNLMYHSKMFINGTNKIKHKNLKYFYHLKGDKLSEEDIKRIENRYEII